LWLIKVWFSASTFVVKIATFAKPENVNASFDRARKTLRPGGIGEASFVTDALSNRFRETEYMLNLKADYALGKKGVWRIMGGYEIQHLSYKTFEGTEAEAIDPNTGQATKHQMEHHC
jgi:hypothetical protein